MSPRAAALAALYEHAAALASAGDLEAARALHAAQGALLGLATPASMAPSGAAEVHDLHSRRRRPT